MLVILIFLSVQLTAQNSLVKEITAQNIDAISIDANQIFNISVTTSQTSNIKITSTLDGEYQNEFQVVVSEKKQTLQLSLEPLPFHSIPDDKRNAHKVIAATLQLEIPENRTVDIVSDIGSVEVYGQFKSLYIQLYQGQCYVEANLETATINTFDGDIKVMTKKASVKAQSNHGEITLDEYANANSIWNLKSIKGNITVAKPD